MNGRALCGWSAVLLLLGSSLVQEVSAADESRLILLNSHVIDTSRPRPAASAIPEALRLPTDNPKADEIVLVKFPGPVTASR